MSHSRTKSLFFFKIAIMCIQNRYFWLWWVDVSHRINVFCLILLFVIKAIIFLKCVALGSVLGAKVQPSWSQSPLFLARSVARSLGRSVTFRSEVMNSNSLHCKLGKFSQICRFGVRFGSQSGAQLVTKPFISRSLGRSVARSLGRSVARSLFALKS